jgi:GT2 family glycosyltransferase
MLELPETPHESARLPWENETNIMPAPAGLPGISVVMPVYNAGSFLEKSIRSLLCNDLADVELILMDGGSDDNTREIAARYEQYFAAMVFEKDAGQSDAINKGFAKATKPILYWLNGDDILLPNALTDVRRAFHESPGTDVIVGDAYLTEKDFTAIRHFQFSAEAIQFDVLLDYASNHLIQPSVFFSREAWANSGPLKTDLHYAMDADLFLEMASKCTFKHLSKDLAFSVYHEDCKTRGKRAESITELALVQAAHGGLEQARKSLNILVNMCNETSAALEQAQAAIHEAEAQASPVGANAIYQNKLDAMRADFEANRHLLIEQDLAETRAS